MSPAKNTGEVWVSAWGGDMALAKCINIHVGQKVLGEGQGGVADGVGELALFNGVDSRIRAVPGAEI